MTKPMRIFGEDTCALLQKRGGAWYTYQNQALDSADAGSIQLLKVGENCTHKTPPPHAPDGACGLGWKWRLLGLVNTEDGTVKYE